MKFSVLDRSRGVALPAHSVSPVSSIAQALDRWRGGDRVEVLRSEFLDVLASVPDPRDPRGRRYPLDGLLAIAILATAAGMGSYAGFATWAATAPIEVLAQLGDDPVSATDREDVPSGISTTGSSGSGPPPRRLFHRAGRDRGSRRGQIAGGRSGRQDAARGASGRSGRRAPGVGVRPPRPARELGQLAVAEKSNEIPCVRKILHPFRQVRLLVTVDVLCRYRT